MKKFMLGAMLLCSVALQASMRCKECGSGYTPQIKVIHDKENVVQSKVNNFMKTTDGRIHDVRMIRSPQENKIIVNITYCVWR